MKETTEKPVLDSAEVKYLQKLEQGLDDDITPFLSLTANLHVGYGGECTPELAEKVDSWVRETLFRAAILKDVTKGEILIGWDEERSDIVVAIPPDGYLEAFEEALKTVKEFAAKLTSVAN